MRCEHDEMTLTRALYGELNVVQRWRLARRLRHCADCAAEWRSLQEVHTMLSSNDLLLPAPSQAMPARRLPLTMPIRPLSLSLAGGLTVVAVGALLMLPRLPRLRAETVGKALRSVNTWHLHGWRLVDGRKVDWDIWGRRTPYFYREQSGDAVIQEDDTTQTRVLPADPSSGRGRTVVLLMPSTELAKNDAVLSYRNMVNAANWFGSGAALAFQPKRDRESDLGTVFQTSEFMGVVETWRDTYYTVDRATDLPVNYGAYIRQGTGQRPTRTQNEFLQAQYNLPLPAQIVSPQWPRTAVTLDLRRKRALMALPTQNVATAGSLTVQAAPVAMDREGNVLLRVRGWFGGIPLAEVNAQRSLLHMAVNMSEQGNRFGRGGVTGTIRDTENRPVLVSVPEVPLVYGDDLDRPYVFVQSSLRPLPNGDWLVVLAPVEPISDRTARPRRLRFTLAITPMTSLRPAAVTDAPNDVRLFTQELQWNVGLPTHSIPGSLAGYYPPQSRTFQRHESLEAAIASEIAGELNMAGRGEHDPGLLKRAVTWQSRVVSLTQRDPLVRCEEQYMLALFQAYALQRDEAARTLHEAMTVAAQHRDWNQLRRQMAHALRDLDHPDAWDSGS